MSDFLSIANELAGPPKASGFAGMAADFAPSQKKAAAKKAEGVEAPPSDGQPPQFAYQDREAFRRQIAKNPALLAEFDRQNPPPQAYADGRAVIPGAPVNRPAPQEQKETLWDKVNGGMEAARTTLEGIPASVAAGWAGLASAAMGGNPDETAKKVAERLTYAPKTDTGKRYVEAVGKVGEQLMPMAGLGAELGALGRGSRPAAQGVADTVRGASMDDFRASFQGKQAPGAAQTAQAGPTAQPGPQGQVGAPVSLQKASPELQAAVAQAARKGPVNKEVVGRHVEADTLPVPVRLSEGQASLDPKIVSNETNGRGGISATDADFFNRQGKQLVQNAQILRERAAPDIQTTNHVETGQLLVDRGKTVREPIVADIRAKYKALADANGGSLPVSGQAFVKAADEALHNANRTRFLPGEVKGILDDLREGGPMTFNDFEAYRTILAEQIRKAERSGDGTAAYAVGKVRDALETLPMEGGTAQLKSLADAARKAARDEFARQERDPAYRAIANDSTPAGELSPLADKFIENYVVKGKAAHVKELKANLGGDSLANQAIAAGAIDYLTSKAGADMKTGAFSQSGWNTPLKASIEPKILDLMDADSAQLVKQIGNVAKYTQVQPRGHFVNNSNTFTAAAANKAATVGEKIGNAIIPGADLGSEVRGFVANRQRKKAAEKSIAPGAGITRAADFPGVNE